MEFDLSLARKRKVNLASRKVGLKNFFLLKSLSGMAKKTRPTIKRNGLRGIVSDLVKVQNLASKGPNLAFAKWASIEGAILPILLN